MGELSLIWVRDDNYQKRFRVGRADVDPLISHELAGASPFAIGQKRPWDREFGASDHI